MNARGPFSSNTGWLHLMEQVAFGTAPLTSSIRFAITPVCHALAFDRTHCNTGSPRSGETFGVAERAGFFAGAFFAGAFFTGTFLAAALFTGAFFAGTFLRELIRSQLYYSCSAMGDLASRTSNGRSYVRPSCAARFLQTHSGRCVKSEHVFLKFGHDHARKLGVTFARDESRSLTRASLAWLVAARLCRLRQRRAPSAPRRRLADVGQ